MSDDIFDKVGTEVGPVEQFIAKIQNCNVFTVTDDSIFRFENVDDVCENLKMYKHGDTGIYELFCGVCECQLRIKDVNNEIANNQVIADDGIDKNDIFGSLKD